MSDENSCCVAISWRKFWGLHGSCLLLRNKRGTEYFYYKSNPSAGFFYKSFDIKAMIAAPFFYLVGGSATVMSSTVLAVITDVTVDDTERYMSLAGKYYVVLTSSRTKRFGYIQSVLQATNILAPVLAAICMEKSIWLPLCIAVVCFTMSFLVVPLLPDTRRATQAEPHIGNQEHHPSVTGEIGPWPTVSDEGQPQPPAGPGQAKLSLDRIQASFQRAFKAMKEHGSREYESLAVLLRSRSSIRICLFSFLVTTLAKNSVNVLLLYVSKTFLLKISKSAYLLSVKAGVSVLLFLLIIPIGLNVSSKLRGYSKTFANVQGARISLVFLGAGTAAIAASPSIHFLIASKFVPLQTIWSIRKAVFDTFILGLVVYALGWGFNLFIYSIIVHESLHELDEFHTGRIFSAVGLIESIGSVTGNPVLSGAWALGINIGGPGLGLPFWVCAGLYTLVGVVMWRLKVQKSLAIQLAGLRILTGKISILLKRLKTHKSVNASNR